VIASIAGRSELVDAIFIDLTADLVTNKGNRQLLNRMAAHMSEGVDAPSAWVRAKNETGVPTSKDQYLRLKEYTAMKAAAPLATAPDLPRTPVRQPGRIAAVARGDRERPSGLLTDDPDLAQAVSDWIEKEQKRRGSAPSWKEGLMVVSAQRAKSKLSASETPTRVRADSRGFAWSWTTGWDPIGLDPLRAAREVALQAQRKEPEIIKGAEETGSLRDQALGLMRSRNQSLDTKDSDFSENFKKALVEASQA
jgi:hypothetical protein